MKKVDKAADGTELYVDAQEMAEAFPDTFQAPYECELNGIRIGTAVKICAAKERFWVELTSIEGDELTGSVDNDLIFTDLHGLRDKSVVHFEKRHIYQIMNKR